MEKCCPLAGAFDFVRRSRVRIVELVELVRKMGTDPGASMPTRTRLPFTSTIVIVILSPMMTFSPGFLLRTSITGILHALRLEPLHTREIVGQPTSEDKI